MIPRPDTSARKKRTCRSFSFKVADIVSELNQDWIVSTNLSKTSQHQISRKSVQTLSRTDGVTEISAERVEKARLLQIRCKNIL